MVKGVGVVCCEGCFIKVRLCKKVSFNMGMFEWLWLVEFYCGYGEWLLFKSILIVVLLEKVVVVVLFFCKIDLDDDV